MPDWFFLAHQTMTDMPFVGAMTAGMGLVLVGLRTPEDAQARAYEVKVGATRWRLSGWHLVFGAILVCALPQILYLSHAQRLASCGTAASTASRRTGTCFAAGRAAATAACPATKTARTPGPRASRTASPTRPTAVGMSLWRLVASFEPVLQALLWSVVLGTLLYINWGERRMRRLYYLAALVFRGRRHAWARARRASVCPCW